MADDLSYISKSLRPLAVAIDSLKPDPKNARVHSSKNLAAICASLERFGQQKPIVVDKKKVVRAGNGLVEAAKLLEWTHVAAISTELTGQEATAFGIADNRASDLSEWDSAILSDLMAGINEEELRLATGFADNEVEILLKGKWRPDAEIDLEDFQREDTGLKMRQIRATEAEWATIDRAVKRLTKKRNLASIGTALAEICSIVEAASRTRDAVSD